MNLSKFFYAFNAILLLSFYELGLRLQILRSLQIDQDGTTNLKRAKELSRIVSRCRGVIPFCRCLAASKCLLLLLKFEGISGELRLGVKKTSGKLLGHAWVLHNGVAILGENPEEALSSYSEYQYGELRSWV